MSLGWSRFSRWWFALTSTCLKNHVPRVPPCPYRRPGISSAVCVSWDVWRTDASRYHAHTSRRFFRTLSRQKETTRTNAHVRLPSSANSIPNSRPYSSFTSTHLRFRSILWSTSKREGDIYATRPTCRCPGCHPWYRSRERCTTPPLERVEENRRGKMRTIA